MTGHCSGEQQRFGHDALARQTLEDRQALQEAELTVMGISKQPLSRSQTMLISSSAIAEFCLMLCSTLPPLTLSSRTDHDISSQRSSASPSRPAVIDQNVISSLTGSPWGRLKRYR